MSSVNARSDFHFSPSVEFHCDFQKDRGNSYLRKGAPVNKSAGCRRLEKNPERSEETCELPALPKKKQEHPVLTNEIVGNGNGLSPSPKSGDGSSSPGKDEKRARARRSTSQVCYVRN